MDPLNQRLEELEPLSELDPWLRNNEVLPHDKTAILEGHLKRLGNAMSGLELEINRLEEALSERKKDFAALKVAHDNYSKIRSPARGVPPELWAHIFCGDVPKTARNVSQIHCFK